MRCRQPMWLRGRVAPLLALALTTLGAGCGGGSRSASKSAEQVPRFEGRVQKVWDAGGSDEKGRVALSYPSSGAIGPGGRSAVVDRLRARPLLIDSLGRLLETLGTKGFGPGEFQNPSDIGFYEDSLIWVSDQALGRITWLRLDGTLKGTSSVPREQIPRSPWIAYAKDILADRSILAEVRGGAGSELNHQLLPVPVALWNPQGTMHVIEWVNRTMPIDIQVPNARGLYTSSMQPIEGWPIVDMASDGRWFFVLDRTPAEQLQGVMHIARYDPAGRLLNRFVIHYRSRAVDERVMKWLRAYAAADQTGLKGTPAAVRARDVMAALWIPKRLPPVRQALADSLGFWMERELTEPGVWERYDLNGQLLARIKLPDGFRGLACTRSILLGYTRDSLSAPVLERYRVSFEPSTESDR